MANDFIENKKIQDYIMDKTIINMYNKGFSIKFIAKDYYRYKNKKQKPIKIDGCFYFPPKIYNIEYCRMYVSEVIYNYCISKYSGSEFF